MIKTSSTKSFTLIELLIVIAIIGLLASVVLVSTRGVREKANIVRVLEFSQSVQHVLGSEAVGMWSFDEGPEGALLITAKDASGYGNNGTCSGGSCPIYTSNTPHAVAGKGQGKYALSFDGVDDYVDVSDSASLNPTDAITIEMWLYRPTNTGVEQGLIAKFESGVQRYNVHLREDWNPGGRVDFDITTSVGNKTLFSVNPTPLGEWFHLVTTYDGSFMRAYINGSLDGETTHSGTISAGSANLTIGKGLTTNKLTGIMDEVRIYEKAMTLGEIQKHYAKGLKKHQDLVLK